MSHPDYATYQTLCSNCINNQDGVSCCQIPSYATANPENCALFIAKNPYCVKKSESKPTFETSCTEGTEDKVKTFEFRDRSDWLKPEKVMELHSDKDFYCVPDTIGGSCIDLPN